MRRLEVSRKLMIVVNDFAYFISHRKAIAVAASEKGYEVTVVCPEPVDESLLPEPIRIVTTSLQRRSRNPFTELRAIGEFCRLFSFHQPDIVHLITIKPYLYGGVAARLSRVPAVLSAVAGLGTLVATRSPMASLRRLVLAPLFRLAFGHRNQIVLFQNDSDPQALRAMGALPKATRCVFTKGAGVDLRHWIHAPEVKGLPVVLMASRLLVQKGVFEFVEAARRINGNGQRAEFWLAGKPDNANGHPVDVSLLSALHESGVIKYLGHHGNLHELMRQVHIVCLPSYYGEGVPKVLLEAAASGRPIVTTDMPGCRDTIDESKSGISIPPRDVDALVEHLLELIDNPERRRQMGRAARRKAEREFGLDVVIDRHLEIYGSLLAGDFSPARR